MCLLRFTFSHQQTQRAGGARRLGGFTLLESLMAAALMSMVVLAVASGITTAQQVSYEGQKRILASMVAEDLMLELSTVPYLLMQDYNGLNQEVGALASLDGQAYPSTFRALGRYATVVPVTYDEPTLGVTIRGLNISVTVRDAFVDILTIQTFIAEPSI